MSLILEIIAVFIMFKIYFVILEKKKGFVTLGDGIIAVIVYLAIVSAFKFFLSD